MIITLMTGFPLHSVREVRKDCFVNLENYLFLNKVCLNIRFWLFQEHGKVSKIKVLIYINTIFKHQRILYVHFDYNAMSSF